MGVLSCSRNHCSNIMCDTYVDGVGYVCWECRKEFEEYMTTTGEMGELNEGKIIRHLKKFMDTNKGEYTNGDKMTVSDFFKQYTK